MNVVIISGRLTKKPELRSSTKTSVCQFSLAVDNGKIDENGKRGVDFIECVCFGKIAENLCKYKDKGGMLELKGHIQIDKYVNNDNKNVYKTMIYVEMINYISQPQISVKMDKNDEKRVYADFGNRINNENGYQLPF